MTDPPTFVIGQRVFFWTGRGSQGHGTLSGFRNGRALIEPEPDAIKGSDFRPANSAEGGRTRDRWTPRDLGVPLSNLNTPARPWYQDN